MTYRLNQPNQKTNKNNPKFSIRNGASLRIAFNCFYLPIENADMRDHTGWPQPSQIDDSSQMPYPNEWTVNASNIKFNDPYPIDLVIDGYTSASIFFDDDSEYLVGTVEIESRGLDNNIVRAVISANFPTFKNEKKEIGFTVFLNHNGEYNDELMHGTIVILPGPQRSE